MPDTLKAAIRTAFQAAVGLIIVFVTGLGQTALGWVDVHVPTYSGEAKLLVTALIAVVIGAVTFVVNWVQNKLGLGTTPEYTPAGAPPKEG